MQLRRRTVIARRLRRDATEVEKRLWRALRELERPHRFRRQHRIGSYVVDFACPSLKLAIELDGAQHAMQEEADAIRTSEIAQRGYRVIRSWNNEVLENLSGVLERITEELAVGCEDKTLAALQGGEGA